MELRLGLMKACLRQLKSGQPDPAFVRSLYPRGVVFVHVPKCGGTSVEEALRRAFPLSRFRIDAERSASAARLLESDDAAVRDVLAAASQMRSHVLNYALGSGYACITGHAPLTPRQIPAFASSYAFVTLMRDPVARFKSHYTYSYLSGRHGNIAEPLDAFLNTLRARDLGQLFLKYYGLVEPGTSYNARDALARSKETLEAMAVVGFVDRMDVFAADIRCALSRPVTIGHANRGDQKDRATVAFSAEHDRRIAELCAADIELYEWARARFGQTEKQ